MRAMRLPFRYASQLPSGPGTGENQAGIRPVLPSARGNSFQWASVSLKVRPTSTASM